MRSQGSLSGTSPLTWRPRLLTPRTCGSLVVFELPPLYLAVMAVLPRRKRKDAVIRESISAILAEVAPLLRIEHCRIDIVEYSGATGRLTLQIDGSCPDCKLSPATFMPAIEAHLKLRVPEVREVRVIGE